MVIIAVPTSDSIIWEKERVVMEIHHAMSQQIPFTLDMLKEGPDLDSLGLMTLLTESASMFDYDLSQTTLLTGNLVQSCHDKINILKTPPWHFVYNTRLQLEPKTTKKTFSKKLE